MERVPKRAGTGRAPPQEAFLKIAETPSRQVLVFSASWCHGPCNRVLREATRCGGPDRRPTGPSCPAPNKGQSQGLGAKQASAALFATLSMATGRYTAHTASSRLPISAAPRQPLVQAPSRRVRRSYHPRGKPQNEEATGVTRTEVGISCQHVAPSASPCELRISSFPR